MRARVVIATVGGAAVIAALLVRRNLRPGPDAANKPTEVNILDTKTVAIDRDGPASSVQAAEIVVGRDFLERIWAPDSLELLARGYWAFLRKVFLGMIRVYYSQDSRTVTAFGRIPLLRFGAPLYETSEGSGQVTWPVNSGILVARTGRGTGHLRVSVKRCDHDAVDDEADAELDQVRLIARVEVENFYPGLRGSGWFSRVGAWFYAQTQLRIHVIVCTAFLRSLPNLDFADVDTTSMPSERDSREQSMQPTGG